MVHGEKNQLFNKIITVFNQLRGHFAHKVNRTKLQITLCLDIGSKH